MRAARLLVALLFAPYALAACGAREPFPPPLPLGLDLYTRVPVENPLTEERVELGRRLFLDKSISADGTVSCSSCHQPEHGYSDTLAVPAGVYARTGSRNAPSLFNVTYREDLFWDGRSTRIEDQVLLPLQGENEMGQTLEGLVGKLDANASYRAAFRRTFGGDVTAENVARALASFVRTLRSGDSQFDGYLNGDSTALSLQERRGLTVFNGRGCIGCHGGPTLTDGRFHNTGVAVARGTSGPVRDVGRFAVTKDSIDLGAFRTPSLRNVALTAPYMHDGTLKTLAEVIKFYDEGGRPNPTMDERIRPLRLTAAEKSDLEAFLRALSGR